MSVAEDVLDPTHGHRSKNVTKRMLETVLLEGISCDVVDLFLNPVVRSVEQREQREQEELFT